MRDAIRVTKIHHACLLVEGGTTRILIDPGGLGDPPSLEGLDAILITHRHFDHLSPEILREALTLGIPVWAPADAYDELGDADGVHEAAVGASFVVGTLRVEVAGDRHAEVHPELSGPENRAYLIGGAVFVTGDEHPLPPGPFRLLATPIDAPWLRATDLIRYVRALRPVQVMGVHDGLLNADGLAVAQSVATSLETNGAGSAVILADGASITVE